MAKATFTDFLPTPKRTRAVKGTAPAPAPAPAPKKGRQVKFRVYWNHKNWEDLLVAYKILSAKGTGHSRRRILEEAMGQVPGLPKRPTSQSYFIINELEQMRLQEEEELAAEKVPVEKLPIRRHINSIIPAPVLPVNLKDRRVSDLTVSEFDALLIKHQQGLKLDYAITEQRIESMVKTLYSMLMKQFGTETNGEELFAEPTVVSSEVTEIIEPVGAAKTEEVMKSSHSHPIAFNGSSAPHKPKILVFGALEKQRQYYQDALPSLSVDVSKDLNRARGDYVFAVILKDFTGHNEQVILEGRYGPNAITVSGAKTRAIEAIKNHLRLA